MIYRRARYGRRQQRTDKPEIMLAPLIDTTLVLLIAFMVATPLVHNAIIVELPSGAVQEVATEQEDTVVYWDTNNNLYLNGARLSDQTIIDLLKKRAQKQPDLVVFIQADRGVAYGGIVEFIDVLKASAGVKYVALETKQKPL